MKKTIQLLTSLICIALCGASAHAADKWFDANGTTAGGGDPCNANVSGGAFWSTSDAGTDPAAWVANDTCVFSAGTPANTTATLNSGITAAGIKVEDGKVVLAGASAITIGVGSVTLAAGTTLSTSSSARIAASVGSVMTVGAGATVETTNPGAAGSFVDVDQTIVLLGGATFSHTAAGVLNIVQTATTVSGTGPLTKTGAGILAIASACTYSGATIINNGTLRIRTTANRLPTGTDVTITSPGIFDPAVGQSVRSVNGNGNITFSSSGTLTLSGNASFPSTIPGVISDGSVFGSITKNGAGTLTLGGVNTYDGTFTMGNGVCTVNSGASLCGPLCFLEVNGGTLNLNNAAQTVDRTGGTGGTINLSTGHVLTIVQSGNRTNASTITGDAAIIKQGASLLALAGANTYTGNTTVSVGRLRVDSATALGTTAGYTEVASGAEILFNGAAITFTCSEPFRIAGAGLDGGAITVENAAAPTISGPITLTADATVTVSSSASATFDNAAAFTSLANQNLTLQGGNNPAGVKVISGAIALGSGGLTKLQGGKWTLSGVNTYTGPTTVGAGTLLVNSPGSLAAGSAVSVGAGATAATLGGDGTINGLVTVAANGTLAPGASIGTLTLGVAPSLGGTVAMEVNKAAGPVLTSDKLVVSTGGGTLAYAGALTITVDAGSDPLAVGDTFNVFDADAFSGAFTTVSGTPGPGLAWDISQLTVDGTIKVVCNGTLVANAGPDQSLCNLGSAVIGGSPTATGGSGTYASYSWSPATGLSDATIANPTANPTTTTIYTVTVTDSQGCTAQDSVTVTAGEAPTISAGPANTTVCSGASAIFSVTASGPGTIGYSWAKNDNGGWGNAWAVSGSGGSFRASATGNNFGDPVCTSFSSASDINSPSGNALGMWGGASGDTVATRTFAALSVGQAVSIDFDNGNVDSGRTNGFSLQTSGGADVLQFYFLGGAANYKYNDGTEQDTGVPFQRTGVRVQFALTSASAYTLIVTPCGGSATKINGTYSGTIAQLKLFNQNTSGGADYDIYFNNFLVGGYTDNADNYSGDYASQDKGNQPIGSGNGLSTYTTPALSVGDSGSQYQVVVSGCGGSVLSSNATVTVNPLPTITLGANPVVCFATTSADLSYSATTESPDKYSVDFDTAAETAGFVDVVDATLPASPIAITVPGAAPAATYNGTLTVKNSTTGCVSAGSAITVTVNPVATANAGPDQTVCADNPTVTLAGSIGGAATSATWSGGAGSFTPDNITLNATYTPTAGEITAGTVTLTLTTDDPAGPCGPVDDSMTITINPIATVDAGADQTVCASSPDTTLAGSFGGAATGATWSGAGTFAPNATTLNAVYTPTASEIAAGTATVTLTTDDPAGPCGAANDSMVITINPAATASAGPDQTVCYDSPTVTLAGSFGGAATSATWSGAGTFTPDSVTMNATYTPTAGEITAGSATVTLTSDDPAGPCGPANDTLIITINAAPAITDQPTNLTVCASSPAIFSVGATGAGLTYQWQGSGDGGITFTNISDTATNASYTNLVTTVADSGYQYQVIVSSTCGPSLTSAPPAVLTVDAPATVDAGADQTVCASSPDTTLAGAFGGAATSATWSGAGSFAPNATTLNAVYTPTAGEITAGTATVTLTTDDPAGPCGAVNDSMVITINPVATVDAGADQTVCASSPDTTLAGAFGGAATSATWSGAGVFTPNATTLNAVYTPTAGEITAGTATVTLTTDDPAGLCGPVNDTMTITINPVATVDAGADQTVCASSPDTTLAGAFGGAATSATWSGAGVFAPNATTLNAVYTPTAGEITAGTATVTLTSDDPAGPCGAVNDSMVITINPVATVDAGADQTVCASSPDTTLAGAFGGAATSATWSGAGVFTPNATTLNAVYTPTAGEITAGTATVTLTTDDPAGPCGAVNDSMVITINPVATVDAGADQTVCASSPDTTLAGAFGGAATSATWSGAGTFAPNATTLNAVYTPTAGEITAGTATVTLTSDDPAGPCGAVNDSMVITINPVATVDAGADQTVCASSPDTTLAGAFGGAATSATWSGAGTFAPNATTLNAVYTPTAGEIAAGTATVTLTSDDPAGPCGAVNDSMVITINPVATVDAGADQTVCASSPDTTLAGAFGGAATSATWSGAGVFTPNATTLNAVYTPTAGEITAGTATVTLTTDDPAGPCGAVNDSMVITINPVATVDAGADQTVCASSPDTTLAGAFGGAATSATWSGAGTFAPNATTLNAVYTPTAGEITAGTATVTLTTDDPAGPCGAAIDTMVITINPVATVDAGPDQTVSAGSPDTTLAGSFAGAATSATWSGAGTFAPNATTMNAVYTPTAGEITAGTATVTLTTDDPAGPCGAVNDSMVITITPALESVTITSISGTTLTYTGGSGSQFVLLKSADVTAPLSSWSREATNTVTGGTFTIPAVGTGAPVFYSIKSE